MPDAISTVVEAHEAVNGAEFGCAGAFGWPNVGSVTARSPANSMPRRRERGRWTGHEAQRVDGLRDGWQVWTSCTGRCPCTRNSWSSRMLTRSAFT